MDVMVAILVYVAVGLCLGLFIARDAVLGLARSPRPSFWLWSIVVGPLIFATWLVIEIALRLMHSLDEWLDVAWDAMRAAPPPPPAVPPAPREGVDRDHAPAPWLVR